MGTKFGYISWFFVFKTFTIFGILARFFILGRVKVYKFVIYSVGNIILTKRFKVLIFASYIGLSQNWASYAAFFASFQFSFKKSVTDFNR